MSFRYKRLRHLRSIAAAIAATTAISSPAFGDVIFETEDPFGGAFGILGMDVFIGQSVAVRFTPNADYDFDIVRLWLWNNDESGGEPAIRITLQDDITIDGDSVPGGTVFEQWDFNLPTTGRANPELFEFVSSEHPLLEQGVRYWIVAESESEPLIDPVWAIAANDSGPSTTTDCYGCEWEPAGNGAIPAMVVEASPHANVPGDFNAFRGFFNSGDLDSLLDSDDDKLCYNPGIVLNPTEAPVTLDFFGTLPNDSPATLDVTIESSANTVGLELTFSFWNFNTNSWDVVGTDTQSLNADTVRTFAGNPADHVEPGTGEVRTRYEVRVVSFIFLFPWLDCVDHVFWTTT